LAADVPAAQEPAAVADSGAPDGNGGTSRQAAPARAAASPSPRPEPSWPRVLATTIRLWLLRRRRRRTRWAVLLLALVLAAGSGVLLARRPPAAPPPRRGAGRQPVAVPAAEAAGWVAAQVSRGVLVSCDLAMCSMLRQHGFPPGNLVMLHPQTPGTLESALIVVTPAVRTELGEELTARAPVVLAGFGSGVARVEVRAVASGGAAAYLSRLRADVQTRKSVGSELLLNPAVTADPSAREQLSAGSVDTRLIAVIGLLAVLHPVHLVSFGDASPGASPGVPLRSAVLYGVTHGVTAGSAFLGSLRALLLAQQPSYRPAGIQPVRLATGQGALRVWFAAPDPLGLLNASEPLVKISSP
jgi:hypothetical protein